MERARPKSGQLQQNLKKLIQINSKNAIYDKRRKELKGLKLIIL